MMRYSKLLVAVVFLLCGYENTYAQNCGLVDSLVFGIVDNGNGTSDYSFTAHLSTTSGGSKSVQITIYCGTDTMVMTNCQATTTTPTTVSYGPFTRPNCASPLFLDWSGHTNSICGGSSCAGDSGVSAVPVTWLSAGYNCSSHQIQWSTASEINNSGFEVQKLLSDEWVTVAWVGGMGNSNVVTRYNLDLVPESQRTLYRIKQIDYDGKFSYSDVFAAECIDAPSLIVGPNPVSDIIRLSESVDRLTLYNTLGVAEMTSEYTNLLDVRMLKNGFYHLEVENHYQTTKYPIVVNR